MSDKVVPCAWCGEKPVSTEEHHGRIIVDHCCDLQVVDFQHHDGWNACQERLLAARRKDFEAGMKAGKEKFCRLYPCKTKSEYFDDYIGRRDDGRKA